MELYKVTVTNGALFAPSIYVDAKDEKDAVAAAKQKSGLSPYPNWGFEARAVKTFRKQTDRKYERIS